MKPESDKHSSTSRAVKPPLSETRAADMIRAWQITPEDKPWGKFNGYLRNGQNQPRDRKSTDAYSETPLVRNGDKKSSIQFTKNSRLSGEDMPFDGNYWEFFMPAIRRLTMVPCRIDRQPWRRVWKILAARSSSDRLPQQTRGWRQAAARRRAALAILVLLQTLVASWSLTYTFPYPWLNGSETAMLGVFAILFSWISFGFWTALMGFWMLWSRSKRFRIDDLTSAPIDQSLQSRTAVLMPIRNENVERVYAGIEATYRSLAVTGQLPHFDFYILSDSNDPETVVSEEIAWAETCRALEGFGKIFYRHRRNNIKRKSGNIADFLRRWGGNYDYMIVFDADSVMSGETLVRLARIMDLHPHAGIVQTVPATVNCESLFARVQQFAGRAFGPMLAAGVHFWQLGESYYWGHNAILRIAPFVQHCGLARLPGKPPLGAEILSHDFVEAALMGRAGWEVWIVPDLAGSYEEMPPTLLDELKRDQRWCQGNLQHLQLLLSDGIRGGHRAIMSLGIMGYTAGLFWVLFLMLSAGEVVANAILPPVYFSSAPSLFPIWPQWRPEWAIGLLSTTLVLLFLPKFLSLLVIVKAGETRLFGGLIPLCASLVLEMIISSLLAPIRMWFHSKFVAVTVMGRQIKWGAQHRTDNQTSWREAIRFHGFSTMFGLAAIVGMGWLNRSFLWWLLPVLIPLLLSIPLSVYSSRVALGRALRRWRLFLIPEEIETPPLIAQLRAGVKHREQNPWRADGFMRATVDPYANAIHVGFLRGRRPRSARAAARNRILREAALSQGSKGLSPSELALLLRDAESMAALHRDVWQLRDSRSAQQWRLDLIE